MTSGSDQVKVTFGAIETAASGTANANIWHH
jgi:hypothetical protein